MSIVHGLFAVRWLTCEGDGARVLRYLIEKDPQSFTNVKYHLAARHFNEEDPSSNVTLHFCFYGSSQLATRAQHLIDTKRHTVVGLPVPTARHGMPLDGLQARGFAITVDGWENGWKLGPLPDPMAARVYGQRVIELSDDWHIPFSLDTPWPLPEGVHLTHRGWLIAHTILPFHNGKIVHLYCYADDLLATVTRNLGAPRHIVD